MLLLHSPAQDLLHAAGDDRQAGHEQAPCVAAHAGVCHCPAHQHLGDETSVVIHSPCTTLAKQLTRLGRAPLPNATAVVTAVPLMSAIQFVFPLLHW